MYQNQYYVLNTYKKINYIRTKQDKKPKIKDTTHKKNCLTGAMQIHVEPLPIN